MTPGLPPQIAWLAASIPVGAAAFRGCLSGTEDVHPNTPVSYLCRMRPIFPANSVCVCGEPDVTGSSSNSDPVRPVELLATTDHACGIDPERIVYNHLNQPRELVKAKPVTTLFA